jgi:LuxR family transcriptional regulator, quorum-sensing system regulator CviR
LELDKWISKSDALKMLEIVNACLTCKSEKDYRKLVEQFNELLFFDYSISALVDMQNISSENMNSYSINSGYPSEYLEAYTEHKYHLTDPLYEQFGKTFGIQNTNELNHFYQDKAKPVLELSQEFGLYNTFLYGICGSDSNVFTVFTITGTQVINEQRTVAIIKYLTPYLSIALKHLVPLSEKNQIASLTSSELEVLKWVKGGKSSWEISVILKKSESVVRFHISNILKKFNAANRTHAVAIALESNILEK